MRIREERYSDNEKGPLERVGLVVYSGLVLVCATSIVLSLMLHIVSTSLVDVGVTIAKRCVLYLPNQIRRGSANVSNSSTSSWDRTSMLACFDFVSGSCVWDFIGFVVWCCGRRIVHERDLQLARRFAVACVANLDETFVEHDVDIAVFGLV